MKFKFLICILAALKCAESANILGVFPVPGGSHYILAYKLMKGLAAAGHNVTMISPFVLKENEKPKNGKYTDVVLEGFVEDFQIFMQSFNPLAKSGSTGIFHIIHSMMEAFIATTNNTLHHPNVQKLLSSNQQFDAVIMEQFNNDALKVFSHIYGCPLILLSSTGSNAWVNGAIGNPQPPAYVPHLFIQDFSQHSLVDRAKNLFAYIAEYLLTKCFYTFPKYDEIIQQAFPDAPSVYDLYTNTSLVLLNSHISYYNAVPMVPNMVEIGGYFIDPPKKLPKDLQDYLDSAQHGVIYFSMGSNLKSANIPEEKKKVILSVLGKLKQKVLWKFEEDLPNKPSNVMIKSWMPQQDILAHPNIQLFISHGGLLSTTEAIYHGVPILAIPVFADQPANADRAVKDGYALKLEYSDPKFSEKLLGDLVKELLENPKYRENAKFRSKVYHDRPQKPMDTAVYWVEYVIRHNGAQHLRVAGIRMPWYKYFFVDVIGLLIAFVIVTIYVLRLVLRKLLCKKHKIDRKKLKQN